jgi:hypothetical protein
VNHRVAAQSLHRVTEWHKSSHSQGSNDCVEVSGWRKSSYSQGENDCVEVAGDAQGWVGVRDSKLGAASPVLLVSMPAWHALLTALCTAGWDRLTSGEAERSSAPAHR